MKDVSAKEHHEYISRAGAYSPMQKVEDKNQSASSHLEYIQRQRAFAYKEEYEDLVCTENKNMPFWAMDNPNLFWVASEEYERVNGRTYTEFLIALPHELSDEENKKITDEFCLEMFGNSFVYSYGIHSKPSDVEGIQNIHAHIMFSERKLDGIERDEKQFFKRYNSKFPERGGAGKDRFWNDSKMFKYVRKSWENILNKNLEKHGLEKVSADSLDIQRLEAQKVGDKLKEEFLNRPPVNCPGKILMKLKKHGEESLTKKEKKQYELYLLAKEIKELSLEKYQEELKQEKRLQEERPPSSFVIQKHQNILEEKAKNYLEELKQVIRDRAKYVTYSYQQDLEKFNEFNEYELLKEKSKDFAYGLGSLILENSDLNSNSIGKEVLLSFIKEEYPKLRKKQFYTEDVSHLKHDDFIFLGNMEEVYKMEEKSIETELFSLEKEKKKLLEEHEKWLFEKNISIYIKASLEFGNKAFAVDADDRIYLKELANEMDVSQKYIQKLEEELEGGKIKQMLHLAFGKEKKLEKERKEFASLKEIMYKRLKEEMKDSTYSKHFISCLLKEIDQENILPKKEYLEIANIFQKNLHNINFLIECKKVEKEYFSQLAGYGELREEKVIKKIEKNWKKDLPKKEERIKEKVQERKEERKKPYIRLKRMTQKEIEKELKKFLQISYTYGIEKKKEISSLQALEHPERFQNKKQILQNYKIQYETYHQACRESEAAIREQQSNFTIDLFKLPDAEVRGIYKENRKFILTQQKRISSILDKKKEQNQDIKAEFEQLAGFKMQLRQLDRIFSYTKKELEEEAKQEKMKQKQEKEKARSTIKKLSISISKEERETVEVSKKRERTPQIKRISTRNEKEKIPKSVYLEIPKIKKKKRWKDLVDNDFENML